MASQFKDISCFLQFLFSDIQDVVRPAIAIVKGVWKIGDKPVKKNNP